MHIIQFAVTNPVKVAVGVIFVVLFGVVGYLSMPVQLTPEVEVPRVTVETRWPGASPAEVEQEIVKEQEEQLNTVEGVVEMTSESKDSSGSIFLEFPVGSDTDANLLLVNNKLNQVAEYPPDADKPVISNADSANSQPIAWFMLGVADEGSPLDIEEQRTFAVNTVEAELEKVKGVAQANTFGGKERRLEVEVRPAELAARQISLGMLRDALRARNQDVSGGDVWEGKRKLTLRTLGRFREPTEVEDVIITRRGGRSVYVRDVADVRIGYKQPDSFVRRKGTPTLAMNVLQSNGTNVLEVMAGIHAKVDELNAGILKERGLFIKQVYDQTEYIDSAVELVQWNIVIASVLTTVVLLLFLRSFWPTLVLFLAIPTSVVGTFFLFSVAGRTLNVISLAGMAFAVGMVVDNAIVVMENVFRHFEMGKSRMQASLDGAKEVWGAVLASTLTTLAVFLPVVLIEQEAGQLFGDIAIAISCAVGLSLVIAMTVIPTASARILRRGKTGSLTDAKTDSVLVRSVMRLNDMAQKNALTRTATVAVAVAASVVGSWLLWPSVEYLPAGNRNLIITFMIPPPGYNIDQMARIGRSIEDKLAPDWTAENGQEPAIGDFFFVARNGSLFMGARASDPQGAAELIPILRGAAGGIPGMIAVVRQTSLFGRALEGGRAINVAITGDDLPTLVGLGGQIFGAVLARTNDPKSALYQAQARPQPSLDLSNPEVHVVPRWDTAADLGISAGSLGYAVDALVDGAYVDDYTDQNDKIDLQIVGSTAESASVQNLRNLMVWTEAGQRVPLDTVATIEQASGPQQINRRDRRRSIGVLVEPNATVPFEAAQREIEDEILAPIRASGQLKGGRYRIETVGTADKLAEAWRALSFNFVLALLITYLLMAGLFESFLYPLVIMVSVPLAAVGGVAGLWVTNLVTIATLNVGTQLDILTMLGFVILLGTVVNNAILIVHQTLNLIRDEGYEPAAAARESTRTRIRPILMSTATTVLGLLPLVVMPGAGSEIYRGLGSVVLGGLLVSTLFTLIVVPTLFVLTIGIRTRLTARWAADPEAT